MSELALYSKHRQDSYCTSNC